MIDAAIVGLCRWGKTLVEAVQGKSEALRFTRAVSRDPQRLRDFAGRHGLEVVGALESVLADPTIDAVVIATPHSLHCQQIIAAADAGKAVFCEKPLTLKKDRGRACDRSLPRGRHGARHRHGQAVFLLPERTPAAGAEWRTRRHPPS